MRRLLPSLTTAFLIPVCLATAGVGTGAAVTHDVDIVDFTFNPATVTIQAGDTVRWTNQDLVAHTATSDTGVWDSPLLAFGESYEFTFANAGGFPYHCTPHPGMLGTVVVEDLATLHEVDIVGFAFDPPTVTIQAGDTVRWTNQDMVGHTSTSDTGVWDSPLLANGESFEFTFADAGEFPYHCTPHPNMLGTVVVEELVAVGEQAVSAPPATRIAAAPNPLFASTSLTYDLSVRTSVRLVVHDATGRLVAELLDGPQAAGEHTIAWDGRLATGVPASTGVYFAHLTAGNEVRSVKLVIVR